MPERTRDEMIEVVTDVVSGPRPSLEASRERHRQFAERILDAALAPPRLEYPTREMIEAARHEGFMAYPKRQMARALLAADERNPIMQAAIEAARRYEDDQDYGGLYALIDAVKSAGKL